MSDQHERAGSRRVLVVGAGPVGLALATELGWRGVPVTVIDQGDGRVPFPAGEAIFSRTMEHLRRWGCAEEARTESAPPPDYPHRTVFATSATGSVLTEFDYGVTNRSSGVYTSLTPEGPAFLSKFSFVPLLARTASELPGVEIRYGTRLETMEQDSEGVLAVVRDMASGATEKLAGTYLVACDGGRSGIRRELGIEFEGMFAQGHNFAVHFRAPQLLGLLRERLDGPAVQIHTLSSARRPYITVVNGVDEWRLSVYLDEEPDPDDAVAWIREAVGAPIDVEVLAAQPWSGHCVVARTYRAGRVFLAGDAAHLLWPKGASAPTPGSATPWTSAGSSPRPSKDGEARRCWTATNRSGGRSPSATSRKPPATGGPTRGSSPIQCSTAWTRKANRSDVRWARRSAGPAPRSSAARASSSATATAAPRSAYRTAARNHPTSRTSTYHRPGPAAAHRTSGCPTAARCSTTSGAGSRSWSRVPRTRRLWCRPRAGVVCH